MDLIRMITDGSKCPSLSNKLKLFLIQACRGKTPQRKIYGDGRIETCIKMGKIHGDFLPSIKNYVIFHSSIGDFASFRHTLEGSYFIQAFCREMNEKGELTPKCA